MNQQIYLLCLMIGLAAPTSSSEATGPLHRIWHSNLLTEDIYTQLSRQWSDRPTTKILLDIIFTPDILPPPTSSDMDWNAYQNKVIGQIRLQQLGVFEPLVKDVGIRRFWKKAANFLFPPTRSWVIRSQISLRSGDPLDAKQLANSLETLEKQLYIKQAQLYVFPQNANTVDLLVTTQDNFPIQVGIDAEKKQLAICHYNVAGWGHTWNHYLSYDQKLGYGFTYQAPIPVTNNLISELNYLHTRKNQLKRLAIFQNFYAKNPYAGLAEISYQGQLEPHFLEGQDSAMDTRYSFHYQNLWLGKAWPAPSINRTGYFYTIARIEHQAFQERPAVRPLYNRFFHNQIFLLGSWGFAHQQEQTESFVYDVGKPEYIPTGLKYNLIGGYQIGEFWNRPYAGLDLAQAQIIPVFGYIASSINIGGFLRHSNIEQGIMKLSANYFTPLLPSKQYSMRHFITLDYLAGFNMFTAERLSTHTKQVAQEWADPFPPGTKRLKLHLETVCWPKRKIAGCQIAIVGFVDAVFLQDAQHISHQNSFCEAVGMGLRVGHERFDFGTIQANFSYQPILKMFNFTISMPINLSKEALTMREPKTIDYKCY